MTAQIQTKKAERKPEHHTIYDRDFYYDSCGVGFIANKSGRQSHDLMLKGHEALCVIPHRGGMSAEGVGDGAGINIDLSTRFFAKLLGRKKLQLGSFGVANFFFPHNSDQSDAIIALIEKKCTDFNLNILLWRVVETDPSKLPSRVAAKQARIHQLIFECPKALRNKPGAFDHAINDALIAIEEVAYADADMSGFYPLSMSARTIVYKGRLNSGELIPYFKDLTDPDHEISIFLFHTRFSTNTAPAAFMAQPFRWMAHNGELNTDKKNRLSEDAIAKQKNKCVIFPQGQSDSARLDQTIARRIIEDGLDIVTAVVAMMPPAWENDPDLQPNIRAMYEYFSLYEEKNDGPAALVFSDGLRVGAKLDRMGLRPLRSIETEDYLAVTSEAGQIDFPPETVLRRGRIEAGGIICFDKTTGEILSTNQVNNQLANAQDYSELLNKRAVHINDLPDINPSELDESHELSIEQRHVAYSMNQESFRFLLDPMIITAGEKISAMGYGVAANIMTENEGGMSKYFSQRFAQVTNPPLDSIREKDGMTLRVALGSKPNFSKTDSSQIVLDTPILKRHQLEQIKSQNRVLVSEVNNLYEASREHDQNELNLNMALLTLCEQVELTAREKPGIIVVSDRKIGLKFAPIPAMLSIAAINQRLIESGLRFNVSLIMETGQAASSHDIASLLGFGAQAICPISVHNRIRTLNNGEPLDKGLDNFQKAIAKSLMKTMGKFGLCTAESYIGGEFFESNFLDTSDPLLKPHFPNLNAPVGGAGFSEIAASAAEWHYKSLMIHSESEIPHLGLFKERNDGPGHSFGLTAVQAYKNMTDEEVLYASDQEIESIFKKHSLNEARQQEAMVAIKALNLEISDMVDELEDVTKIIEQTFIYYGLDHHTSALFEVKAVLKKRVKQSQAQIIDKVFQGQHEEEPALIRDALEQLTSDSEEFTNSPYKLLGFQRLNHEQIDSFKITRAYKNFVQNLATSRADRPAALRDILHFPTDIQKARTVDDFSSTLGIQNIYGNAYIAVQGLQVESQIDGTYQARLTTKSNALRLNSLCHHWASRFPDSSIECSNDKLIIKKPSTTMSAYLDKLVTAPEPIDLNLVQLAHEITSCLTAGAMSHGALVGVAHESVSQGANIAGALSNSGEGGEKAQRYNTVKSSSIKQIASGRFGVWAGYFADPNLKEIEIKIAQGAKPGEGGQLPGHKVNVEIASSRGGTPLVELVSPPPHHDTYSIEDLAQLIHDAHAARVKVIVKLVSSEGIGTIAVGVAKAGADVINIAGSTGGTGAAAVTSLKNTGRSAEIGIAEVHKALANNLIRSKVILRASNAHQTGSDVVKSAIMGADSFEFGTTALMMLKCVMAKNCNVKCPAGLTTNPEFFKGDARALAQYFLNIAHDIRQILARLGYKSLREIRGKTSMLHLVDHPSTIGTLDFRDFLDEVDEPEIKNPRYLEANFRIDDELIQAVEEKLFTGKEKKLIFAGTNYALENRFKSVGGQLAIDIERSLQYVLSDEQVKNCPAILVGKKNRRFLAPESIQLHSSKSAGQSYGCWMNDGMLFQHIGTCNDGVGKGACGGVIIIKSPQKEITESGQNVLIGNFALFGASGGQLYVNGEAGDRFAVRNSGALAVVEGVGDFCCEYMTSGTVLNLGSFGKGFCNGMSGGNTYQYDPENRLEKFCASDSVSLQSINKNTNEAIAHEMIIVRMLHEHVKRTDSTKAAELLKTWPKAKEYFKFATPIALFKTQTVEGILNTMDKKTIVEELAISKAREELQHLATAYKTSQPVLNGISPEHGETDTPKMFKLLKHYTYLVQATEIAREQLSIDKKNPTKKHVDLITQNLIIQQDSKLVDSIVKYIKLVLQDFTTEELADMLVIKRINDYKSSMSDRDVQDNNSLGATAWILDKEHQNSTPHRDSSLYDENHAKASIKKLLSF